MRGPTPPRWQVCWVPLLTHHFQLDYVRVAVSFHIGGGARVVASLVTGHALQRQISAAHNDAGPLIVLDDLILRITNTKWSLVVSHQQVKHLNYLGHAAANQSFFSLTL